MTDDLEAQARRVLEEVYGWHLEYDIPPTIRAELLTALASWARRLVAESRAGAIADAVAVLRYSSCTCARQIDALAAEAEPGAQP